MQENGPVMRRVKKKSTATRAGTTYVVSEAHKLPSWKAIKEDVVARCVLRAIDARERHFNALLCR
jgi:hypothetical protein